MTQPEPWLRGIRPEYDPVCGHLLRSSEQIREDARRALDIAGESLSEVTAFHLRHLAGSTDRLCTYAEGRELSREQFAAMEREKAPRKIESGANSAELIAGLDAAFDRYDAIVRATRPEDFGEVRYVGRKKLPVTLIGLLIHIAEHGQRHAGQAITTAKHVAQALSPVRL